MIADIGKSFIGSHSSTSITLRFRDLGVRQPASYGSTGQVKFLSTISLESGRRHSIKNMRQEK
jgi:hypothetical protein